LEGRQAGVRSTPTAFINGIRLKDRILKGFQATIDKQLVFLSKINPAWKVIPNGVFVSASNY
jgi:hypothetical protein